MIAKTLAGLEDVLEQELIDLGAENVEPGRRMVSFYGDKRLMYKANLHLRTALRILKPIYEFDAEDEELFYAALFRFDWGTIMDLNTSFAIDTVVYSTTFTHSKFIGYKAKDAIVDWFAERDPEGRRPNIRLTNPDIRLHIHVAERHVTLCLDSSGESLHKRGYRQQQDIAPINEVLAAGILLKAGWKGDTDLLDPFCGSGTFLIEAALIARNIAPGVYRDRFAFEGWKDFDATLYNELYDDDSQERPFEHHIYGSDISKKAIAIAQANVKRAGVRKEITLTQQAFQQTTPHSTPTLIVMNPPYGERIDKYETEQLYQMIGSTLKHSYAGCEAWVIAHKPEHFNSIGLRQSFRQPLFNGALECELRGYSLFSGSNKEFKQEQAQNSQEKQPRRNPSFGKKKEIKPWRREEKSAYHKSKKQFEKKKDSTEPQRGEFKREKPFTFKKENHKSRQERGQDWQTSGMEQHNRRPSSKKSWLQVFESEENK